MRILSVGNMYPPHHLGGYELTWRSAVAHLRSAGYVVRILTTDYRSHRLEPGSREDPDVHRELRWYWHEHGFPQLSAWSRLSLERHNARVLDRHLAELEPDVVNWWAMGGMSLSLVERARRAGLPAVGVVGDDWMSYGPRVDAWTRLFSSRPRLGALAELATGIPTRVELGSAGCWLFNSELMRRRAMESQPRLSNTAVAHPGIDEKLFRPAPAGPWRGRLLYVGRIDERKGIDTAVRALASLDGRATLTILGSGDEEYRGRLAALAAKQGTSHHVAFDAVPRSRLPERYAHADAVVFPVRWAEPWGLVPLEAMAVGTPVVATGTGGSAEYLRHEQNCLIFGPRDDPEALAAAVNRLAGDERLRRALRESGFRTASRFTEASYNAAIAESIARAAAP